MEEEEEAFATGTRLKLGLSNVHQRMRYGSVEGGKRKSHTFPILTTATIRPH